MAYTPSQSDQTGGHLQKRLGVGTPAVDNISSYENAIIRVPCELLNLTASNEGTSPRWVMLFDSLTEPSPGSVSTKCIPFGVGQKKILSWTLEPSVVFNTGVYWVISSTQPALTVDPSATFNVMASYSATQ